MAISEAAPRSASKHLVLDGVRVGKLPAPGRQDVTYVVLSAEPPAQGEKRRERRWRTHLRYGKIVDAQARILIESQTKDRSARGARLRLAAPVALPRRIRFFDDVSKHMFEAAVAWQRGRDVGLTLLREIDLRGLTRAQLFRLGIKIQPADA